MKEKLSHLWYVYSVLFFAAVCLVIAGPSLSFGTIVTVELGSPLDTNPDPYIVDIPLLQITEHSEIELRIQNIEDPMRYKEWELTVFIPQEYPALTHLAILDYEYRSTVLNIENVPMALGSSPIPGYAAYYADTTEAEWYVYGTQPIGAGWGRIDVGNPAWISFHFDSGTPDSTPVYISVHDICIPEPTTMCVFGVGAVLLFLKKQRR